MKLILVFFISILIISCNTSTNTPKTVVESYLDAIDHFDFEKANESIVQNEENLKYLENIKASEARMSKTQRDEYISHKKAYTITVKNEDDKAANVFATYTQTEFPVVVNFNLIFDKQKWLIESIEIK